MTTNTLAMSPAHLAIIQDILRTHLPPDAQVFVFGSRAQATNRRYSDLDLLIDAGRRLTIAESADLSEAFSESDLPWKVDVIDRNATETYFLDRIMPGCIPLPRPIP
jgi:predicted nucleotidyltransferase